MVDSSVIVKWLSADHEDYLAQADTLLVGAQRGELELLAPELAQYEVGNVLLKGKGLSVEQGLLLLKHFAAFPLTFVAPSERLTAATYAIAYQHKITFYDAAFLAVAAQYDAMLVTDNVKHQGRVTDVRVVALKDY